MFQQYPQREVNAPVLLHEGRFRVRSGDQCAKASGSARLRWLPRPGIEFEVETDEPCAGFDPRSLTVELPRFRTKNVVALSTHWGSTPSSSTSIRAAVGEMEWGGERSLLSVGFQIVNFPDVITPGSCAVPGDPTTIGGDDRTNQTLQNVALDHDGWQIRIVAVPGSRDRREQFKAKGGYAFTHVGQLTRVDDSAFSVEEAKGILESLRQFLSFARGAACALPIHWGRGEDGEIVWRRFQSPIVDPWARSYTSWFDEHHGEILAELFDSFCGTHKDPRLREPLGVALHWYRHCNTNSSGLEGSLVLGFAALELLGALIVVDLKGSMKAKQYDNLRGAEKLQELLSALKVQPDIPGEYQPLAKFAQQYGNWDSCQALAKLRNGIVHADERNRGIVWGPSGRAALPWAWQLSLWYQEWALLRVLKHRGSYFNRSVGQVEPVPWSGQ